MRTLGLLLVVLSLVVAGALATPATASALAGPVVDVVSTDGQADRNANVAAGERLSSAVASERSQLADEVDERALVRQLAGDASDQRRAAVVAARYDRLDERIDRLGVEYDRLDRSYERGDLDEREYRTRVAILEHERLSTERSASRLATVSRSLPPEAFDRVTTEPSEVFRLETRTDRLGSDLHVERERLVELDGRLEDADRDTGEYERDDRIEWTWNDSLGEWVSNDPLVRDDPVNDSEDDSLLDDSLLDDPLLDDERDDAD